MKRVLADSLVLCVAYLVAFLLRFDFQTPSFGWGAVLLGLPMMLVVGMGALTITGCERLHAQWVTLSAVPRFVGAIALMVTIQLILRWVWDFPAAVWLRPPLSIALMAGVLSLLGILALRYVGRLQLRPIKVEELLGRSEAEVNTTRVLNALRGKTVVITGAGGSIGFELTRQVLAASPKRLILIERSEVALYTLCEQLEAALAKTSVATLVGDCGDRAWIRHLLRSERPEIVLHAAAYKHVPILEVNPCAALKNNALATRTLAEASAEYGVQTFVLISSDKAVRPISVLGITKRLAELFVLDLEGRSQTHFCAVRFGNVLESSGSAVPKFRRQIQQGGPVTITDPRMKRYFMTLPEAAGLVLQAATLARGGEILVLDMGHPVSVKQLVETMIRQSGLRPGKDIAIVYTGIRPGEKLEESLGLTDEQTEKTIHNRIFTRRETRPSNAAVEALLVQCIALAAEEGDLEASRLQSLLTTEGNTHEVI